MYLVDSTMIDKYLIWRQWENVIIVIIFTDHTNGAGNAIASVGRPSVCPSVHLFPLYLRKRLTVDLELLHVSRS